ncbi:hypothetical protein N7475_004636 [Penicillium sp. IBT 31633x]|nr:hypothetical protein N7475_004636 [Penicillium sp. IBT 31633x]
MLVLQPPVYTLALLWSSVGHGGQCFYHHEALPMDSEWISSSRQWFSVRFGINRSIQIRRWSGDWKPASTGSLKFGGEMRLGRGGYGSISERDVVKNVKDEYIRLKLKPKYSEEAFMKKRQSWGSLWD